MPKKVIVYTTPTCPYCVNLKTYLKEKGVEFAEIDVSTDQKTQAEFIKKAKTTSVPVVEIDSQIIIGFDKEKIDALLNL